jgi:hypothetical protein
MGSLGVKAADSWAIAIPKGKATNQKSSLKIQFLICISPMGNGRRYLPTASTTNVATV